MRPAGCFPRVAIMMENVHSEKAAISPAGSGRGRIGGKPNQPRLLPGGIGHALPCLVE